MKKELWEEQLWRHVSNHQYETWIEWPQYLQYMMDIKWQIPQMTFKHLQVTKRRHYKAVIFGRAKLLQL